MATTRARVRGKLRARSRKRAGPRAGPHRAAREHGEARAAAGCGAQAAAQRVAAEPSQLRVSVRRRLLSHHHRQTPAERRMRVARRRRRRRRPCRPATPARAVLGRLSRQFDKLQSRLAQIAARVAPPEAQSKDTMARARRRRRGAARRGGHFDERAPLQAHYEGAQQVLFPLEKHLHCLGQRDAICRLTHAQVAATPEQVVYAPVAHLARRAVEVGGGGGDGCLLGGVEGGVGTGLVVAPGPDQG